MARFWQELRECSSARSFAELRGRDVSRSALSGPHWTQTFRGFYRPTRTPRPTPTQRILDAAALVPPGGVIGGWAAAYAFGADLLDGLDDHTLDPIPITVLLPPAQRRRAVSGVRYRQQTPDAGDVRVVAGVPFTRPVRTALDLATWAPDVTEAVVALDTMLKARLVRTDQLTARLTHLAGCRGVRQVRSAVALARPSVASGWESRLRMFVVLDLGQAMPLVNRPVFGPGGRFLGTPDLLDEGAGLAMEYDGGRWASARVPGGHRDPDQHREDNAREELMERAGLIVVRADKGDLTRFRDRLRRRILSARADGLARDRSRDRWTLTEPADWLGMPA